jgi:DNA-binding NtrC family response regulator
MERQKLVSLLNAHVMVLDDDPASRARTHQALRIMGLLHITEVSSTGSAKTLPSMRPVDLVISELPLALGSGLALLKAIRQGRVPGIRPDVAFIFLTNSAYPRMVSAAAHLKASGFVIKPLKTERLREVMLRAFGHRVRMSPDQYADIDVVAAMRPAVLSHHITH